MKPQGKQSSRDAAKLFSSQLVPADTVDSKNSTNLQETEGQRNRLWTKSDNLWKSDSKDIFGTVPHTETHLGDSDPDH